MSPDPRRAEQLDALAHELDRWSAYAHGAIDDARVRHRHVREHVRRAERSLVLADSTTLRDASALTQATEQLDRLTDELDRFTRELGQRTVLNTQLIETAAAIRGSIDAAMLDNLRRQELAASMVSTAARDEQRARVVLHRALDAQRIAFKRRVRRGGQRTATQEVASAEAEARRTNEAHATAKHELATLRNGFERLQAAAAALDLDVDDARAATGRLGSAAHALHDARRALTEARVARDAAAAAQRSADGHVAAMRTHAEQAVTRLEQAAVWERDATGTYEDVQQLAADVALSLRDALETAGAQRRALQADRERRP